MKIYKPLELSQFVRSIIVFSSHLAEELFFSLTIISLSFLIFELSSSLVSSFLHPISLMILASSEFVDKSKLGLFECFFAESHKLRHV